MTEKEGFKVTNISENGNTGLFWLGKDNLSVYDVVRLLNELNDENKQLQLQMLRLYNYFEDYFEDIMSPDSFSEMWDIVKESEKWEKGD